MIVIEFFTRIVLNVKNNLTQERPKSKKQPKEIIAVELTGCLNVATDIPT